MKTNFKTKKESKSSITTKKVSSSTKKDSTQKEFEDHIRNAGAAGSFMIFRSKKKKDELGLDEI